MLRRREPRPSGYRGARRRRFLQWRRAIRGARAASGPRAGAGRRRHATDAREIPLGGPKQRLVLALLLAEPNTTVSIDRLIDGVWGESPPDSARHTLQSYVSELRKALGEVIERDTTGYAVRVDRDGLDALDFEARVERGPRSTRPGSRRRRRRARRRAGAVAGPARSRTSLIRRPCRAMPPGSRSCGWWRSSPRSAPGWRSATTSRSPSRSSASSASTRTARSCGRCRCSPSTGRGGRRRPSARSRPCAPRWPRSSASIRRRDSGGSRSRSSCRIPISTRESRSPPRRCRRRRAARTPTWGSDAFRESDAARFFGQERLIAQLAARVSSAATFTAVVGPSGSGKSSVVQAGLLPQVRRERRHAHRHASSRGHSPLRSSRPRSRPCRATTVRCRVATLRATEHGAPGRARPAARRRSGRLLLVVDQFEELFTLTEADEAEAFLAALSGAADDAEARVHVLVTMRADFYDRPLADPPLRPALRRQRRHRHPDGSRRPRSWPRPSRPSSSTCGSSLA